MKRKFFLLKLGVSILILAALVYYVSKFDLDFFSYSISPLYIILLFVLLVVSLAARAWRWLLLMNEKAEHKVSFVLSFKLLLIGQALNFIMPASSGDIAKGYFGYKQSGIKERMFTVSLYDKLLGIASIGILAVFSVIISGDMWFIILIFLSFLPIIIVFFLDSFLKLKLFKFFYNLMVKKFKKINFDEIRANLFFSNKVIIQSFVISFLAWIATYALLYICFITFNLPFSFTSVLVLSPIITLARLFPLTLNGLGSDEALIVYLFSHNNNAYQTGILFATLLYRIVLMVLPALIGLILINFSKAKN